MKLLLRCLMTAVVAPSTFFGVYWNALAWLDLELGGWTAIGGSLLAAVVVGWIVWTNSGRLPSSLVVSVCYGACLVGGIGFAVGFFGPIFLTPESNQGPLLGLLITGPAGFLGGAIGGGASWAFRRRRAAPPAAGPPR